MGAGLAAARDCQRACLKTPGPVPFDHRLDGGVALLSLLIVVPWLVWRGRQRHAPAWHIGLQVATAVYAAVVVELAFFPFPLPPIALAPGNEFTFDYRGFPYPWLNPVPFDTIGASLGRSLDFQDARFLVGNVLAFAPVGALVPLLSPAWNGWRRVLFAGFGVSLAIESAQLGLSLVVGYPYRTADVDDVLLNTIGVLLGYLAFRAADRLLGSVIAPERVFW